METDPRGRRRGSCSEVCVYAVRLATDKIHREWIKAKVREKLQVIRQDFEPDDRPRDGRGRFTKSDDEGR